MGFLHGVETISVQKGARSVEEVKTAVIGLVGIAPTEYGKNTPVLVTGDKTALDFGAALPGFDIPQSLNHILAQGAGTIVVINVFDETLHTVPVADEAKTITNGKLKLANAPIGTVTMKKFDGTATDYVAGTDYTIDAFGNLTVINGRIPNETALKFDYKKLDAATVTTAHIIGTVDGSGNRTGIKAFEDAFSLFGFNPKILIAPGRSATKTIADELVNVAEKLRAIAIIDSTLGDTMATVLANRGDATKAFATSNKRAVLVFPYLKGYDESKEDGTGTTDTTSLFPYSPYYAGVVARTDAENGYWWSPSNKELRGALGLEVAVSSNFSDENSDSNLLNGAGITTVFNSYGTGYRTWGNRNASYPTSGEASNFISLLRIFDVVHESLELASLQFIDRPGNAALIDDIRETGNGFLRTLIGRGALIDGSNVSYDPDENPITELAKGHYTFTITLMGPPPAERITFKSVIDVNLLGVLNK